MSGEGQEREGGGVQGVQAHLPSGSPQLQGQRGPQQPAGQMVPEGVPGRPAAAGGQRPLLGEEGGSGFGEIQPSHLDM